jgi:hypothetical protein
MIYVQACPSKLRSRFANAVTTATTKNEETQ